MTDNEIIKALECCTTNGASCKGCPAFVKVDRSNCKKYFRGALDLINRQQAEIERLKEKDDNWATSYANAVARAVEAKSEARKEFAEFLKARKIIADTSNYYGKECITDVITVEDIDNLLKEMG